MVRLPMTRLSMPHVEPEATPMTEWKAVLLLLLLGLVVHHVLTTVVSLPLLGVCQDFIRLGHLLEGALGLLNLLF